VGVVPFERELVTSYRPSIVTFPLFLHLHVSEIAAFVHQHATFSHPHLLNQISLLFQLGVGGWPLGYEQRRRWTNCPCN